MNSFFLGTRWVGSIQDFPVFTPEDVAQMPVGAKARVAIRCGYDRLAVEDAIRRNPNIVEIEPMPGHEASGTAVEVVVSCREARGTQPLPADFAAAMEREVPTEVEEADEMELSDRLNGYPGCAVFDSGNS